MRNLPRPALTAAIKARDLTAWGDVRVDVLETRHNDLDRDFTDPTDRLEAMAHQTKPSGRVSPAATSA